MDILIIEDEQFIAERLIQLLNEIEIDYTLAGVIASVEEAIEWLSENPHPDLILADIQLSDGNSFSIFKEINVESKVIFTTSFDDFALDAFKVNSIDYLLKPITAKKLKTAFDKLTKMQSSFKSKETTTANHNDLDKLLSYLEKKVPSYKSRFLIKVGNVFKSIKTDEIAYFYVNNRTTYLMTYKKRKYSLDIPLDELDGLLNPQNFFRINRQMIVDIKSIKEIHTFFNSRLLLTIDPEFEDDVVVTRSNITDFKEWMNK